MLMKNSMIPQSDEICMTTLFDNQEQLDILVYQGEGPKTANCKRLGKFELCGISKAPVGTPDICVELTVDKNGILKVNAFDETNE
jgi:molecular chaperone DnaK (HSP70)